MTRRTFIDWLGPVAGLVFAGGWILAIVAFLVIGTQNCATVQIPVAGQIKVCQNTTSQAVILLAVVGFGATLGSLLLWSLRYLLETLSEIEANTRSDKR